MRGNQEKTAICCVEVKRFKKSGYKVFHGCYAIETLPIMQTTAATGTLPNKRFNESAKQRREMAKFYVDYVV